MFRPARFLAFSILIVFFLCPILFAGSRGIAVEKAVSDAAGWGNFYALIIGINDYEEWNPLHTAVKDATALQEILVDRYGFTKDRVVLLTDKEASRSRIVLALRNLAAGLKKTDNLLIYYAGHGQIDDLTGDGYWIPAEGKLKDPTTWVSHSTVKNILSSQSVRAKNVVLLADACYSGSLLRDGPSTLALDRGDYIDKLRAAAARFSRQVITSGGMEPVADGGKDGHSLFAYYLLKALKENDREVIDLENLFHTRVWKPVTEIGRQRPNVGRLQTPMDDDGQFVLINRAAAQARAKKAEAEKQKFLEQQQWREKIKEERDRIEAEKRRLEQEKDLLAQRRELELEKLKIEQEKQRLALEAERARLEAERRAMELEAEKVKKGASRQSMQTASLSAPVIKPDGRLPLRIALMPWRINTTLGGGAAQGVNEKHAFNIVMEAISEDNRLMVSHSYYDYDPPPDTLKKPFSLLKLTRKEANTLWKKDGFFSRAKPDREKTLLLAEKHGFDIALFICEFNIDDEQLILTLVDAGAKEEYVASEKFYHLTFDKTLTSVLNDRLHELLKKRGL